MFRIPQRTKCRETLQINEKSEIAKSLKARRILDEPLATKEGKNIDLEIELGKIVKYLY